MTLPSAAAPFPLDQADLCVKCGLCLPHCPTYAVTAHEGDSPRGRIALMQGLATGVLSDTSIGLQAHLDGCLGCRSCEKVCPAQVPYGELIDAGRVLLARRQPQRLTATRMLGAWLTRPALLRIARLALLLYTRSGLQAAARRLGLFGSGRLARLEATLPARIERRQPTETPEPSCASVQLFSGCVSSVVDQATLNATRRLCARLGIALEEPSSQTCCGALHQHAGLVDQAQALLQRNLNAFGGEANIAWCASGCGATLDEYGKLSTDPRAARFAARARDIHEVVAQHWPADLRLQALPARALLHLPCTQRNVTGGAQTIVNLLRRIPQLQIESLDDGGCCGAAGSYFVTQPAMADRLLAARLDRIAALAPDLILSSNIGCGLHLAGGLRRRGLKVAVLHPVQLLERQAAAAVSGKAAPPGAA